MIKNTAILEMLLVISYYFAMQYCNYLFTNIHKLNKSIKLEFPVQVMGAGYELIKREGYDWTEKSPREDKRCHILQYTVSGTGWYSSQKNGKTVEQTLGRNSLFLASHDRPYRYWSDPNTPWSFYWIMLTGPYAQSVVEILRQQGQVLTLSPDTPPVHLMSSFLEKLGNRYYVDPFSLSSIGYEFLTLLMKHFSGDEKPTEQSPAYDLICKVQNFIRQNIHTVDLAMLAEHFGYNKIYFNSYFKKKFDTTPHQYILKYKIKYASMLLSATSWKVRIVARDSGFENENYFSKVFKKHTGKTPEQYRSENRGSFSSEEFIVL
jgi:AraC-like DNA-binding protein